MIIGVVGIMGMIEGGFNPDYTILTTKDYIVAALQLISLGIGVINFFNIKIEVEYQK